MKMYIFAIPLVLLQLHAAAQDKKPFTLTGNIKGLTDRYIYLSYPESTEKYHTDSVKTQNGNFTFKGALQEPSESNLTFDIRARMYGEGDMVSFFMVPGSMQIASKTGHLKDAKLTGSKVQDEQYILDEARAPIMKKLEPIYKAYADLNQEYMKGMKAKKSEEELAPLKAKLERLKDDMEPYQEEIGKKDAVFMGQYPNSYVTAQLLRYKISNLTYKEAEAYYAKMSPEMQQSTNGKELKKEMEALLAGSPGSVAHVFSKTDINGQTLNLDSLKGKYVMLDFWASWCGPCRKGNSHLKELYSKYKEKGFEIVGVSDDDSNPAAWKKAVAQDGIGIWRHVLRGLDWERRKKNLPNPEDTSDYYGIHSLPTKILIDPHGMIIGRYGGGGEDDEAMNKKLKEIFGA